MFVTFLALYTLYKREHVMWLVLICALSVGVLRRQRRRIHNRARRREFSLGAT